MTNWNNYIMRKYDTGIRIKVFESYYNGYLKGISINNSERKIREDKLQKIMDDIPEDKWVKC